MQFYNFLISYGSINTIFVSVYPWSKVYVEIFVIQILLISIVLSNKSLEINLGSKIYKYIVLFFLVIMFLIILDSYTNQHIMIFFFNILEGIQYEFFEVDNSIVSQILLEYFNRLKTVKDYNLFFYYAGSILILFFFNKKFIKLKNFEFYF